MTEFLFHSLLFDSFRWSEHRELQELSTRMLAEIPRGGFKRKTVEKLENHLRLFLCNLYLAYYYRKPVAISLKAERFSHGRYHDLHLKRIPFTAVYKYLREAGWIEYKPGYKPFSSEEDEEDFPGSVTRIWPSSKLEAEFAGLGNYFPESAERDCIVVRDEGKKDIPFEDNVFTMFLRSELSSINRVLSSHYFSYNSSGVFSRLSVNPFFHNNHSNSSCTPSDIPLSSLREPNEIFRRFRPQVKVVFSNGDFACGGRIYHAGIGDWQSMPQSQRATIRIDNCRTVELDFSSFHISMLYALEGRQISGDPYHAVAPTSLRPVVKKLLLTVLNASSTGEAANSMTNQVLSLKRRPFLKARDLKFLRACDAHRPDWHDLISRLKEAHPAIEKYFCSGAGLYLQRVDSEIMRNVLVRLAAENIPCLPVHDSAVVQYFREAALRREMEQAYQKLFPGFHCKIERK